MYSKRLALAEIEGIAEELLKTAGASRVWLFFGDLGSGKTTLIKHICTLLGGKDRVHSPSFTVLNTYNSSQGTIHHFDFYRLENAVEVLEIGVQEYFYSGMYCFVEWPEVALFAVPPSCFKVRIDIESMYERIIHYERVNSGYEG